MSTTPSAASPAEAAPSALSLSTTLHLRSTLHGDARVPFIPASGGRRVTWYTCGPTVYDVAHMVRGCDREGERTPPTAASRSVHPLSLDLLLLSLICLFLNSPLFSHINQGHARTYVAFDTVRRVLEDWFGYDVTLVMNVTDVDDKIIARARRGHLLKGYRNGNPTPGEARSRAAAALAAQVAAQAAVTASAEAGAAAAAALAKAGVGEGGGPSGGASRAAAEAAAEAAEEAHKHRSLLAAQAALAALPPVADLDAVLATAGDALAAQLDEEGGAGVTDRGIFR